MKTSNLIVTFLGAATAQATVAQTYVFYAFVEGTLKALRTEYTDNREKAMIWGDLPAKPMEFFYEYQRASSSDSLLRGDLISDLRDFRFTKYYVGSLLNLGKHGKLLNSFYYSCERTDDSYTVRPWKTDANCLLVDLYLLPYDRETKAPIKGSFKREEVVRTPHAFFIVGNNIMEPLSSILLQPEDSKFLSFTHGDFQANVVEFFVQENYAVTEFGDNYSGYAGFSRGQFGFGRLYGRTNLDLEADMRLKNPGFFSCVDSKTSKRIIVLNPSERSKCFEVDIYLLPYDRTSRLPMNGMGTPKPRAKMIEYSPSSSDTPHGFFIKVNTTTKPLSYFKVRYDDSPETYGIFYNSFSYVKPIEFTLQHNTAYAQNGPVAGFAGFTDYFIFGGLTPQTSLDLDDDMRVKNVRFSMCPGSGGRLFLGPKWKPKCYEVEIYFLPFDRTTGLPLRRSRMAEESELSGSKKKQRDLGVNVMAPGLTELKNKQRDLGVNVMEPGLTELKVHQRDLSASQKKKPDSSVKVNEPDSSVVKVRLLKWDWIYLNHVDSGELR